MTNLNKDLIRKNIFKLIDYSGITDASFANLLEISDKQLKRIKKREADFSIDNINKACNFFRKSLASINKTELEIDHLFRDKLIATHKGNVEYSKTLEDRPSITYAINFELLSNDEFINKGLTVNQIRELFRERNWEFSSAYISLAMSRNKDKIERHKNRKGKFIYKKENKLVDK